MEKVHLVLDNMSAKERILAQQISVECRKIAQKIENWDMKNIEKLRQMITDLMIACEDLAMLSDFDFDLFDFVKKIPSMDLPEAWYLKNRALAVDVNGYVLFKNGTIELRGEDEV